MPAFNIKQRYLIHIHKYPSDPNFLYGHDHVNAGFFLCFSVHPAAGVKARWREYQLLPSAYWEVSDTWGENLKIQFFHLLNPFVRSTKINAM